MVQLAFGVAYWILPRQRGAGRGNERLAWAGLLLLNLGVLTAGVGGVLGAWGPVIAAGRAAEFLAAVAFAGHVLASGPTLHAAQKSFVRKRLRPNATGIRAQSSSDEPAMAIPTALPKNRLNTAPVYPDQCRRIELQQQEDAAEVDGIEQGEPDQRCLQGIVGERGGHKDQNSIVQCGSEKPDQDCSAQSFGPILKGGRSERPGRQTHTSKAHPRR